MDCFLATLASQSHRVYFTLHFRVRSRCCGGRYQDTAGGDAAWWGGRKPVLNCSTGAGVAIPNCDGVHDGHLIATHRNDGFLGPPARFGQSARR